MIIDAVINGAVDRQVLGNLVLSSPEALQQLEELIHPLIAADREAFLEAAHKDNAFAVVYDIPLLYEKNLEKEVDIVIVVSASPETQRERVLRRPGALVDRFESILSKQIPDHIKRERADFVINTDFAGYAEAKSQLTQVLESILANNPDRYHRWKKDFGTNGMIFVAPFVVKK